MTQRWDADVAVVGAGPAGAWTALRLAQAGWRVLLFDDSHPREKPCGGGVTARALALIRRAVPDFPLDGVPIEKARFSLGAHVPADVQLKPPGGGRLPPLLVVDRARFDLALAEAAGRAGADWQRERVREVTVAGAAARDGVLLATSGGQYRVGHLVGADGANSLVRRRVHRPFARSDLSIATGYFAHGVTTSQIDIGFVDDPAGYIWSFPRGDHLAIGICAQADETTPAALMTRLDAWMAQTGVANGARLERYGWPIPSLGDQAWACDPPAGRGWLLVGDAAGLVDPITREGIFFGLQSAELAAAALAGPDPARHYMAALQREIVPELARAARIKRRFFRRGFTHLLIDALETSAPIRRVMADLVAGCQPYATLKRRLAGTLHVSLAWRLWRMERQRHVSGPAEAGPYV